MNGVPVTLADFDIQSNANINVGTDVILDENGKIAYGVFVKPVGAEYAADGLVSKQNADGSYSVVAEAALANTLMVEFEELEAPEGEKLYNINLKSVNENVINRLNSADFTFELITEDKIAYEIIKVDDIAVTTDSDYADRYMFSFEHKNDVNDTADSITVAQVKFSGYGEFDFGVKDLSSADKDTNIANATKAADNIVDTFTVNGDINAGEGKLDLGAGIDDAQIKVPVRDLVINVTFPNGVNNNVLAYQDMKVTVSGGDLDADIVAALGTDGTVTGADNEFYPDAESTVEWVDGAYVVTIDDQLTVNTAYNVTVEGAGYRTARYTVTMTDAKELTFWNNVMDDAKIVETGKDSSAAVKNFLAGDIVADNNINVYDLSAVVSYFATTNDVTVKADYAKYDLNRDGVIDSKDVAYVLVSWNN